MKVREIDVESLMAASPTGLTENTNGKETQTVGPYAKPVNGRYALSNYNVWSLDEDEE